MKWRERWRELKGVHRQYRLLWSSAKCPLDWPTAWTISEALTTVPVHLTAINRDTTLELTPTEVDFLPRQFDGGNKCFRRLGCEFKETLEVLSAIIPEPSTLRVIGVDHSARVWTHTPCCACPALSTTLTPLSNCATTTTTTTIATGGAITRVASTRKLALNKSQSLVSIFSSIALVPTSYGRPALNKGSPMKIAAFTIVTADADN
ncbi:hypothetical protein TMatcc_009045 [Talaromyces marneffei ATCC 18224]